MPDENASDKKLNIAYKLQLSLTVIMLVYFILLCVFINFGILFAAPFYLILIVYNLFSALSKIKNAKIDLIVTVVLLFITFWATIIAYGVLGTVGLISISENATIITIIISHIIISVLTILLSLKRIIINKRIRDMKKDT